MISAQYYNPNFGNISAIHSYRFKIYGVFVALLFLDTYKKYDSIEISNQIKYYGDKLEVVNKLKQIKEKTYII